MPLLFFAGMVAVEGAALQSFSQSRLVASEWADGDSFKVRLASGDEIILRLYYVDCPETVATSSTRSRGSGNAKAPGSSGVSRIALM